LLVEIRPDIRPSFSAVFADEPCFQVGEADAIRPWVGAGGGRRLFSSSSPTLLAIVGRKDRANAVAHHEDRSATGQMIFQPVVGCDGAIVSRSSLPITVPLSVTISTSATATPPKLTASKFRRESVLNAIPKMEVQQQNRAPNRYFLFNAARKCWLAGVKETYFST
jgi:hypothetical protein